MLIKYPMRKEITLHHLTLVLFLLAGRQLNNERRS